MFNQVSLGSANPLKSQTSGFSVRVKLGRHSASIPRDKMAEGVIYPFFLYSKVVVIFFSKLRPILKVSPSVEVA